MESNLINGRDAGEYARTMTISAGDVLASLATEIDTEEPYDGFTGMGQGYAALPATTREELAEHVAGFLATDGVTALLDRHGIDPTRAAGGVIFGECAGISGDAAAAFTEAARQAGSLPEIHAERDEEEGQYLVDNYGNRGA